MTDAQQQQEQPFGPGAEPGPYPGGPYPGGAAQPGYGPYPQPPYGYGYPGYPMQQRTNTMAILALVLAFVCAPAGIVLGVLARKQIRRTGEQGMGLATAGMVCGIVFSVLSVIWIIVMITLFATLNHQIQNDQNSTDAVLYAARAYLGF